MSEKSTRSNDISKELAPREKPTVPIVQGEDVLIAGGGLDSGRSIIPLEGLTDEQKQALRIKQAEGVLTADEKARDAAISLGVLDKRLDSMTSSAKEAAEGGMSVTMTGTHKDSYGGVDVMIGNTDEASKGRVPRVATGNREATLYRMGFILIIIVVIAVVIVKLLGK